MAYDLSPHFQYGTRHILDALKESGRPAYSSLLICGGLSKNPLFIEAHAEACDLPILVPGEAETVLVGSAILGAYAAKVYPTLEIASKEMGSKSQVIWPRDENREFHQRKYKVFRQLLDDQLKYQNIMESETVWV